MKDFLFPLVTLIFLLINSSLAPLCGFLGQHASVPIIVFLIYAFLQGRIYIERKEDYIPLVVFVVGLCIYIYTISNGLDSAGVNALRMYIVLYPAAIYMEKMSNHENKYIHYIIWLVLFVEIFISYYERYTVTNVFKSDNFNVFSGNYEDLVFRANGIYYHPLSNSYIISIITIFIVCCKQYSIKIRFFVYILSVFSLLCYNARGNVVMTGIICLLYFLNEINRMSITKRTFILIVAVPTFYFVIDKIFHSAMGGRFVFFKDEADDWGSTEARFEALSAFDYIDTDELMWGGYDLYDKLLVIMDLAGIENSYIAFILRHGLIIGLPLMILMISFVIIKINQRYDRVSKWCILVTFLGIGMTNPHMASCYPWMFFFFSYYAFRPQNHVI